MANNTNKKTELTNIDIPRCCDDERFFKIGNHTMEQIFNAVEILTGIKPMNCFESRDGAAIPIDQYDRVIHLPVLKESMTLDFPKGGGHGGRIGSTIGGGHASI